MKKEKKYIIVKLLCYITIILSLIIYFGSLWFHKYYGDVSFSQILFHLVVPIDGSNIDAVYTAIIDCCFPIIFLSIVIIFTFSIHQKDRTINKITKNLLCIITIIIFLYTTYFAIHILKIDTFLKNKNETSSIYEVEYIDPKDVKITFPEEKRNLIYIFVESMESTYADKDSGGGEDINYIPHLTKLAEDNINFSNTNKLGGALPISNTGWTIAGMIAQTSGITLNTSDNNFENYNNSNFLPNLYTLGQILEEENYNQTFMKGGVASFAKNDLYYMQHGNYKIMDYMYFLNNKFIPETYYIWWGIEDLKLFEFAKQEALNLAAQDEPFNLTIETADTHPLGGFLDETCEILYDEKLSNVINCTDSKIYDFVTWAKEQDFYENTTIIIVGDHLNSDTDYLSNIDKNYTRGIYNVIINSNITTDNNHNRQFSVVDMFPTTLASLGVTIEGNKLGLGRNLFSDEITLIEKYGLDTLNNELLKKSNYYNEKILN